MKFLATGLFSAVANVYVTMLRATGYGICLNTSVFVDVAVLRDIQGLV